MEDFEKFDMEELENTIVKKVNKGEIVEGVIIQKDDEYAYINMGYKMEGKIPLSEFNTEPEIGDSIEALIVEKNDARGDILLSIKEAQFKKAWNNILEIYKDTAYISGKIVDKVDKGYIVDIGLEAFLPLSQIRRVNNFEEELKDKQLMFKILKINKQKKRVIVSRREYLREVNDKRKKEIFGTLKVGDIIEGVIKNIINSGVFVDLGGVDAFIPKSELTWSHSLSRIEDYFSINQKIKGRVISIDKANEKISLSHKDVLPNPWLNIDEKYQVDMIAKGKVVKILNTGVIVELEPGIDGFISRDNLTWAKHIKHPGEIVKLYDIVEFKILEIDKVNKRIKLGLKEILSNPWDKIEEKYPVGKKIVVTIKRVTNSGAYVEIEDNIEGFIDLKDVSWTKRYRNGREVFKKGETVSAAIVDIDKENNLIKLSIKQLLVNPWNILQEKKDTKTPIKARVTKITKRGAFAIIDKDIKAFIPVSHYATYKVKEPEKYLKVGQIVDAVIIDINENKKLATISLKEYKKMQEEKEIEQYLKSTEDDKVTLGDFFKQKNN